MYQNDAMKVLTGEVRLSYANLTTPRAAQQGGEPKYSVTLLIPKSDAATKADIDAAIQAAANEAMAKVWNGARPPMLKVPIYDGDGVRPSGVPFGDECKGHWVMTASTKNKPQVVGIANDTAVLFNTRYVGTVPNDASGRASLWGDVVKLIQELEKIRAVENFDPDTVTCEQGDKKKAVLLTINGLNIINAMAQLYMSVIIQ